MYEYDIYISVPSSHGNVSALGQQTQARNCVYSVAMENENIGILFIFNIFIIRYILDIAIRTCFNTCIEVPVLFKLYFGLLTSLPFFL